jgi:hypothetical protein
MEGLVFGISMEVKDLKKCYELHHLPAVDVKHKSEAIDENNYASGKKGMDLLLIENMVMLTFIVLIAQPVCVVADTS